MISEPLGRGSALACGLAVFVACLAVIAWTPGEGYWINDCGSKALVAARLLDSGFGELSLDYRGAAYDAEGRWFPIPPPFALARDGAFVSAYPPAYAALASPALALFGPRGLRLPAALGAAACAALFALWSAPALGRRWALVGGTALGLATPLFFYGVTVWEHSLTLALTLGAALLLADERPARWAAAGTLVGLACWLREELALMALAVVVVAALRRQPARALLAFAAGVAVCAVPLLAFNASLYGNPLGGHVAVNLASGAGFGGNAVDRLTAFPGLLGGLGHTLTERRAFALLGVLLPLAGALAPRRLRESPWLIGALAAAGLLAWGIAAARMWSGVSPLRELVAHNGLLLQWPLVVLAGVGARRVLAEPAFAQLRTAALAGIVFAALVLTSGVLFPTAHGVQVGAGVHWGPRALLPALPALLLLSLAAASAYPPAARVAWGILAGAGVLSTLLCIWFLSHQKRDGARLAEQLRARAPETVATAHPMLAQHLASLWGEKAWLLTPDQNSLRLLSQRLRRRGESAFAVVAFAGTPPPSAIPGVRCASVFQHRGRRLHYLDLDVQECQIGPVRPARRRG